MSRRCHALLPVVLVVLAAPEATRAAGSSPYTLAATRACLMRLPNAVAGLPPATPPAPPASFVSALGRDALSTWGVGQSPPRAHTQLGVWVGERIFQGVILSFFRSAADARASVNSVAGYYGDTRIRNVVATWDQKPAFGRSVRATVFDCLRSEGRNAPTRRAPAATRATFAGGWGGHTRGLTITSGGRGTERVDSGCCMREYRLTFKILSVSGTLTHATAEIRLTSFERYDRAVRMRHTGDVGSLLLRNGIVTNTLTDTFFCSDPAWEATGACGA